MVVKIPFFYFLKKPTCYIFKLRSEREMQEMERKGKEKWIGGII